LAIAQAHVQLASLNPLLAKALDLAHRYHCEAALRRVALVPGSGEGQRLAVGFADLVGFTALSQSLPPRELAGAISEFESCASAVVMGAGGRVIKLIGDEVMFVADDPGTGCEIGLRLVEAFHDHGVLPPIRGGLAYGDTITQEGDYFGPTVNLAARATRLADADNVLVTDSLARELPREDFNFRRLGSRRLKGFSDPVALYVLERTRELST
jgi:adenylate cyclase